MFFSYGFTTVESLYTLGQEDLLQLQVKPAHVVQLKQALDARREQIEASRRQGAMAQPWGRTDNGEGYQWVDGPGGSSSSAVDHLLGAQPGPSLYGFPASQAGTQWVDTAGALPPHLPVPQAPPSDQDMVFQWVDSPSYGRPQAQQHHYLQAPAPYFPGMDAGYGPPRPLDGGYGLPRPLDMGPQLGHGQGLDLLLRPPPVASGLGYPVLDPSSRYGPPQAVVPHAGHYAQRSHLAHEDMSAHRNADRLQYGQASGAGAASNYLFDRGGGRGMNPQAQRPGLGNARPHGSPVQGMDERNRMRQVPEGPRRGEPAENSVAALVESMGTEGMRAMLISTLESLYEDRIKPMANYVKGRLKERSCSEIMVKSFVELYMMYPDLFVVLNPNGGDEATMFFVKEPAWFKGWVDIDSPSDPYDEFMWQELAKFLNGEHTFAGGRYGMARELIQRNLPFLAKHSLGEVCHIVQLAIQTRRLIVYHRKMLKPIQTVLCQLPDMGKMTTVEQMLEGEEIKDMDDLCIVLFRMLTHHPSGIRLCRMKQMIKHEFGRKLSEMAFQCTKLIELFSQEPLSYTFVLDTENDGKSIYVRLGNPDTFTDHVKRIFMAASLADAKAQTHMNPHLMNLMS